MSAGIVVAGFVAVGAVMLGLTLLALSRRLGKIARDLGEIERKLRRAAGGGDTGP